MRAFTAVFIFVSFLCLAPLYAVRIPLDGVTQPGADGKSGPTDNIGFVDIEVLFNEHPMKKRLQDEFVAEANKRRNAIAGQEKKIQEFEKVIVSSAAAADRLNRPANETGAQGASQKMLLPGTTEAVMIPVTVAQSTAAVENPEASEARKKEMQDKQAAVESMKVELQKMKDDLAVRVKQDKADLKSLEESQSGKIMEDLYRLLENYAKEENLTIILDKNDVLYGQQYQDVTREVLERLQGR